MQSRPRFYGSSPHRIVETSTGFGALFDEISFLRKTYQSSIGCFSGFVGQKHSFSQINMQSYQGLHSILARYLFLHVVFLTYPRSEASTIDFESTSEIFFIKFITSDYIRKYFVQVFTINSIRFRGRGG